jgi:ribonuclease-3
LSAVLLTTLCNTLGYHFHKKEILDLALTHRSIGSLNNERLEFLGDSIVNWVIAEALFLRFPTAKEGELTRLRASLVSKPMLAEIAKEFELGNFLRLGSGELKSGGFRRDSILADALEAVIAGIYLDGGVDSVKQCILTWYATRLEKLCLNQDKDPKTQLQEFLQSRQQVLPEYVLIKTQGEAHNQTFWVECRSVLLPAATQGQGNSRRAAEQAAAQQALIMLNIK